MHHKSLLFIVSLLALLAISVPVNAQSSDAKCEINVTKPLSGQEVGRETAVEGTATLPPGHHLWVFARRDSYRSDEVWWLQSEGIVDPKTKQWKVIAAIGNQNDIGFEFDIAVAVFAPREHPVLRAHRSRSLAEPVTSLTMPVAACAPVIRVVKKVSH